MREADGSMSFAPDRIEVRQGEQIKFALKNAGSQDHEFILEDALRGLPAWVWPSWRPLDLAARIDGLGFV
jgi:uncharacterized cupredoxin-like copper-binding protein